VDDSYAEVDYGKGSIYEVMESVNFSHFAWKSPYDPNTKNVWSKGVNIAMDKNGIPTAIGRALLNGLKPEPSNCYNKEEDN